MTKQKNKQDFLQKKVIKKTINRLLIFLGSILGILLVVCLLTIVLPQNEYKTVTTDVISTPTPSPTPYITPTPIPVQFPQEFKKKQFDGSKMMHGYHEGGAITPYYPPKTLSIIDRSDNTLLGLKCLATSRLNEVKSSFEQVSNPRLTETQNLVNTLKTARNNLGLQMICDTENNQTFVGYIETKIPYDYTITYHVALLDKNKLNDIASFSPKLDYPSCRGILTMTKDNHIYVECDGGDGLAGHYEIYDINFTTGEATLAIRCDLDIEFAKNSCAE